MCILKICLKSIFKQIFWFFVLTKNWKWYKIGEVRREKQRREFMRRTVAESLGAVHTHTHTHTHTMVTRKWKRHKFLCFIKVVYKRWIGGRLFLCFLKELVLYCKVRQISSGLYIYNKLSPRLIRLRSLARVLNLL